MQSQVFTEIVYDIFLVACWNLSAAAKIRGVHRVEFVNWVSNTRRHHRRPIWCTPSGDQHCERFYGVSCHIYAVLTGRDVVGKQIAVYICNNIAIN